MSVTIDIAEHPTNNNIDFILHGVQQYTCTIDAPELTVGYTSAEANRRGFAVRFTNIQIPPGSKMIHARLRAQSSGDYPETYVEAWV
ncbi:unnamed protein product, partial [marine sediment metagenome]